MVLKIVSEIRTTQVVYIENMRRTTASDMTALLFADIPKQILSCITICRPQLNALRHQAGFNCNVLMRQQRLESLPNSIDNL